MVFSNVDVYSENIQGFFEEGVVGTLFMVNIPHDCTESELAYWTALSGSAVKSVRLIRDMVSGVSPCFGYVELADECPIDSAVNALNGHSMRDRVILVSEARKRAAHAQGIPPKAA
jgi:RNA recognition motif-containing protein